jgi:hypothetical protein
MAIKDDSNNVETDRKKNATERSVGSRDKTNKYVNLTPSTHDITDGEDEIDEAIDEAAPLSIAQRRARGRVMRRFKTKIAVAKKRASRRKATPEKLKLRARKRAREIIRKRLAGGKSYSEMSPAEKMQLDKRMQRVPAATLNRIATKALPTVRQAETERLSRVLGKVNKQESVTVDEATECPPKRFHMALTKEGKVNIDRRFKMFRKHQPLEESFEQSAAELMAMVEGRFASSDREEGTDSLVSAYKEDTPGQRVVSKRFGINERFEMLFQEQAGMLDRAIAALHRHVQNGEDLKAVIWDFVTSTGAKVSTHDLLKGYIAKYGDPDTKQASAKSHTALLKKYGFAHL